MKPIDTATPPRKPGRPAKPQGELRKPLTSRLTDSQLANLDEIRRSYLRQSGSLPVKRPELLGLLVDFVVSMGPEVFAKYACACTENFVSEPLGDCSPLVANPYTAAASEVLDALHPEHHQLAESMAIVAAATRPGRRKPTPPPPVDLHDYMEGIASNLFGTPVGIGRRKPTLSVPVAPPANKRAQKPKRWAGETDREYELRSHGKVTVHKNPSPKRGMENRLPVDPSLVQI